MSRCFPYPPPGYCKNGATHEALIESIKLQKENVKSVKDKSERKKEKREKKERKEKRREEKRKEEEKRTTQNNPNEFQPNSKAACFEKTEPKNVTDPRTELLEKSDLTEEHCQPTTSQKPSYSSDSTQNSNKRKRDDVSVPDGSVVQGKPIKIRLLKKHKPDSETEVLCSNSGRSDTTRVVGADAKLNFVSSNRTAGVPVTSGRENTPVHGHVLSRTNQIVSSERPATKSNNVRALPFSTKQSAPNSSARQSLPLTRLKHDIPSSNSNKIEVPVPSRPLKIDVEALPSTRQQPASSYGKSLLLPNQKGVFSSDFNKGKLIAAGKRPMSEISGSDVSLPSRVVKRREDLMSEIPKNVLHGLPGSSAPTRVEGKTEASISAIPKNVVSSISVSTRIEKNDDTSKIPEKASLSRHEKKVHKKFSKYMKVIGSWAPPVVDVQLPVEEDWLSRRGAKVTSSSGDDVETNRELAPSSMWQPCARYLVEADIYALPYTVPF